MTRPPATRLTAIRYLRHLRHLRRYRRANSRPRRPPGATRLTATLPRHQAASSPRHRRTATVRPRRSSHRRAATRRAELHQEEIPPAETHPGRTHHAAAQPAASPAETAPAESPHRAARSLPRSARADLPVPGRAIRRTAKRDRPTGAAARHAVARSAAAPLRVCGSEEGAAETIRLRAATEGSRRREAALWPVAVGRTHLRTTSPD